MYNFQQDSANKMRAIDIFPKYISKMLCKLKGPGTHLLEPVAKENCENSKMAYGSSNEVNAEMLSEKVVLRKFFRLVTSYDDVTVTSPKT